MKTEDLKELSQQRMLNMSNLYREAGVDKTLIAQRIHKHWPIPDEDGLALTHALIRIVRRIMDTMNISPIAFLSGILSYSDRGAVEQDAINILYNDGTVPYGYLDSNGVVHSIFGEMDRYSPRESQHKGPRHFLPPPEIEKMLKRPDCKPTGRGKDFMDHMEMLREKSKAMMAKIEAEEKAREQEEEEGEPADSE